MAALVLLFLSLLLAAALAWIMSFRRRERALAAGGTEKSGLSQSAATSVQAGVAFSGLSDRRSSPCVTEDSDQADGGKQGERQHGGCRTFKATSSDVGVKGDDEVHGSEGGAFQPHAEVLSRTEAEKPFDKNAHSVGGSAAPAASQTHADPADACKRSSDIRQPCDGTEPEQADRKDCFAFSRTSSFSPPTSCSPSSPPSILADEDVPDLTKAEQDFLREQQRRARGRFKHQEPSCSTSAPQPSSPRFSSRHPSPSAPSVFSSEPSHTPGSASGIDSSRLRVTGAEVQSETSQSPGQLPNAEDGQAVPRDKTGEPTRGEVREDVSDLTSSHGFSVSSSSADRDVRRPEADGKADGEDSKKVAERTDHTAGAPVRLQLVDEQLKTTPEGNTTSRSQMAVVPPEVDSAMSEGRGLQAGGGAEAVAEERSDSLDTQAQSPGTQEGGSQWSTPSPAHESEREQSGRQKPWDVHSGPEAVTHASAVGDSCGGVAGSSRTDNRQEEGEESRNLKGECGFQDVCTVGTSAEVDESESVKAGQRDTPAGAQEEKSVEKQDQSSVSKQEDDEEDSKVPRVEDLGEVFPTKTEDVKRPDTPCADVHTLGEKKAEDEAEEEDDLEDKSAAELKERGNKAFREGNYETALDLYTRALDVLDDEEDDWLDEYDAAMQDKEDELDNAERIRYERASKADGGKTDEVSLGEESAQEEEMHDAVEEREEAAEGAARENTATGGKEVEAGAEQSDGQRGSDETLLTEEEFLAFKEAKEKEREEKAKEFNEIRAILLSNRAACHLHAKCWEAVIADCTEAVQCNPNYPKAYLRRFTANEAVAKWHDAAADINKALELDPSLEPRYRADQQRVKKKSEEQFEKEKEEMMGKLKDFGNFVLGKIGLSLDNFKVEQNPDTGAYNISFQQNAPSASAGAQ